MLQRKDAVDQCLDYDMGRGDDPALTQSVTASCTAPVSKPQRCECADCLHALPHTPSIAFGHLPPNSARFGYATEGALFISAQLSTDAVSALRKVRVLIGL